MRPWGSEIQHDKESGVQHLEKAAGGGAGGKS